jgi:hypothetical protein
MYSLQVISSDYDATVKSRRIFLARAELNIPLNYFTSIIYFRDYLIILFLSVQIGGRRALVPFQLFEDFL